MEKSMEPAGAGGKRGGGDVKKHRVTLGDQIAMTSLEFKNSTCMLAYIDPF